ncbi:MAG: nitrogen fixation protein NifQ [Alphaproteobacteria bacterium]|nr:nitrogen fixation protein NifQ [Alphaproteobacteria bacterium]MBM3654032.1 nitrogen fixation protein NifQ [Alphaproteobacteria bacterium]
MNIRVIPDIEVAETSLDLAEHEPVDPADVYRRLTGLAPFAARIDADADFDRHIFACIISVAASEGGALTERLGLSRANLEALTSKFFGARLPLPLEEGPAASASDLDESELVRDILLEHLSPRDADGEWLATMIARRALEPNHLWEDLGLRNRSELTRLMERRFASLAARNDKNMRWKRFIYRLMCENDGFVMCATPVCSNCADYHGCFGEEEGISRLSSDRPGKSPPGA